MNETVLWLLYLISAAVAFAAVYRLGLRIVSSTLLGTAVTMAGWTVLYFATAEEKRPAWWRVDLSLNASFALIFAAAGAALALALLYRNRDDRAVRRSDERG